MRVYTMHEPTAIRIISLFIKLQWLPAAHSTNSRLRNPKYLAFIYASGFESVKEEYFTVKLAALKKHKARNDAIICVMIACVQLHNFGATGQ